MKIIAFYLPQFHEIPENNKWWGEGFTEWTNVRKATKLFKNHNQPRVPLNNNYYNLLNKETLKWQANLATKYGIYGFCIYHYWFGGKKLLEKPTELLLKNKDINIKYCLCWANEDWTNSWSAEAKTKTLIREKYGKEKEWKEHFEYLLKFFKDERYIKEENSPLLVIYRPELIKNYKKMINFFKKEAVKNGFSDLKIAYQNVGYEFSDKYNEQDFDYAIEYQPNHALAYKEIEGNRISLLMSLLKKNIVIKLEKKGIDIKPLKHKKELKHMDYDEIWQKIIERKPKTSKSIPGAFVDWDNTARKGKKGSVVDGASPKKFEKYLEKQIKNAKENYKKNIMFIFSWNEWAEGGYLEPDTKNKYKYLEAVKEALDKNQDKKNKI